MKRYLFLFVFISLILFSAPYKPYPILFVHGMGSKSATWGAQVFEDENGNRTDSIKPEITDNSTFDNFLTLMKPYAWAWYEWERIQYPDSTPTYTPSNDPDLVGEEVAARYPNKAFLEVVNMDDPWGSVDAIHENDLDYYGYESPEYTSWQDELYHRVKEVLEEYYGEDWADNPDAKIILIVHSTGAPTSREMIRVHPDVREHIYELITVDGVNEGSWFATPIWKDFENALYTREWTFFCLYNVAAEDFRLITSAAVEGIKWVWSSGKDVFDVVWSLGAPINTWDEFAKFLGALEIMVLPWDWKDVAISTFAEVLYGYIMKDKWPIILSYVGAGAVGVLEYAVNKKLKAGAIPDLSRKSVVINRINEEGVAPPWIRYAFIRGRQPWDPWNPGKSWWATFFYLNALLAGKNILAGNYVKGGIQLASIIWLQFFEINNDLLLWVDEQDPTEQDAFKDVPRENIESFTITGIWHCQAPQQWSYFIDAISLPPVLDSVMLVEMKGDSSDTTFLTEHRIDSITASPESCTIYFKLDNVYFLAQTRVTVNINGAKIGDLRYPDYKGYDDRWCRIPERLKNA